MSKAVKALCFLLLIAFTACDKESGSKLKTGESNGYTYEYTENDPLNVRIYTLKNGLKVYLSKYGASPRIQTNIAVKAGGKNDPATNTGLAHYLEHIMFKGTADFGTLNWEKESVLLDSIERMFTHYGTLTDSIARADYYKLIDNVSNEAAKYAIANEYDKMVSELGAQGTNAYTTEDRTVYVNDIPANQVDNWLQIEGNRFKKIVPRLFHTELEAVYEEKNRSLDNDYWKTYEGFNSSMFKKHQYGTQTVIGTIAHLKNPSITEIKNYFDAYYRPNNVAICMSGDLDFDKTIAAIDKNFGDWAPNEKLQPQARIEEDPITAPVVKEVYGPYAEWIEMGYRMDGLNSEDAQLVRLTDMILANSKAGLIDLNLKQQQKVIDPTSYVQYWNDYSVHKFTGRPREGQTLEQVRDLMLAQIDLVKKGEFEDWLIEAVINDLKKSEIQGSEFNGSRANDLVMAFTNNIPWDTYVTRTDALRKYTKEDIVKFANAQYGDNYVIVYKRSGKDPNALKVTKPTITKVPLNKEDISPFHKQITENKVEKLQPVYVDYNKDLVKLKMNKDVEVLYTPNKDNDLFTLYYLSDVGTNNNPKMNVAVEYLEYVGTEDMTAEDIQKEFYKLGTSFSVFGSGDQTYVSLEGLNENMDKSIQLFEKLLANAKADDEAKKKMIDGMFKKRDDIKKDKGAIMFSGLMNYGLYGAKSSFTNVVTNKDLNDLKSEELIDIIKNFTRTEHRVLYYGPKKEDELLASLNQYHVLPEQLKPVPPPVEFKMQDVAKPNVYWADYDMVQAEVMFLSKGKEFDAEQMPMARMFNEYFGNIVFQELREAQGLAYSTFASYGVAGKKKDNDSFYAYIGMQADKQPEGMKAMTELLENLPKSENGFDVAQNAILSQIESQRITKASILFNYETARKRGLDYDVRKDIYEDVQKATLADIEKFQQENIKNSKYNVVLIGSKDKINFKDLQKYGTVKQLTLDELFGYEKQEKINLEQPNQ